MEYLKCNYSKLTNMPLKKYYIFILILLISLATSLIIAFNKDHYSIYETYGISNDGRIDAIVDARKIEELLNGFIEVDNKRVKINKIEYGNINEDITQNIYIYIDDLIDNKLINIKFYYQKEKLIKYIFELFK